MLSANFFICQSLLLYCFWVFVGNLTELQACAVLCYSTMFQRALYGFLFSLYGYCWRKKHTAGCMCAGGCVHTCQRWLSLQKNTHLISRSHKHYNIFLNLCHRSHLSIKKKNQNRNLKKHTQRLTQLSLSTFHSTNNFCTISHFSSFQISWKGGKKTSFMMEHIHFREYIHT